MPAGRNFAPQGKADCAPDLGPHRPAFTKPAGGKASERKANGFMLFEVLVALIIAGLVLAAFVQSYAVARRAARLPDDVLVAEAAATSLLRDLASDPGLPRHGTRDGLTYVFDEVPLALTPLPPAVAPMAGPGAPQKADPVRSAEPIRVELNILSPTGRRLVRESAFVASPGQ